MTHICVSKLTTIGSDNGLSPGQRQAIIWSNAGILFNWTLGTNFSEILSEIDSFSFKQMRLKMSFGKWRPYCLGLNVLRSALAQVMEIKVSIGSGNGLLPDGTKPLPEPMLTKYFHPTLYNVDLSKVFWKQSPKKWHVFGDYSFKITTISPKNQWFALTHWGRDEIDAILQTTFSNAFSWMKWMS